MGTARGNARTPCPVCQQPKSQGELVSGQSLREPVVAEVRQFHPQWSAEQPICLACLNRFRAEHVRRLLEEERGELSQLEEQVIQSLRAQEAVSANINLQFEQQLSFGDWLADRLATFGGSWTFLLIFAVILVIWMVVNSILLIQRPFDPYPFILLNLVLSCLAAIQAPVILMSQNRQAAKDRLRSEHDYRVNLKAELEVRLLHAKLDQLLTHQWQRLLEIQELQMETLEEVANRRLTRAEAKGAPPPSA
jgi:uncharacterized membrane protein